MPRKCIRWNLFFLTTKRWRTEEVLEYTRRWKKFISSNTKMCAFNEPFLDAVAMAIRSCPFLSIVQRFCGRWLWAVGSWLQLTPCLGDRCGWTAGHWRNFGWTFFFLFHSAVVPTDHCPPFEYNAEHSLCSRYISSTSSVQTLCMCAVLCESVASACGWCNGMLRYMQTVRIGRSQPCHPRHIFFRIVLAILYIDIVHHRFEFHFDFLLLMLFIAAALRWWEKRQRQLQTSQWNGFYTNLSSMFMFIYIGSSAFRCSWHSPMRDAMALCLAACNASKYAERMKRTCNWAKEKKKEERKPNGRIERASQREKCPLLSMFVKHKPLTSEHKLMHAAKGFACWKMNYNCWHLSLGVNTHTHTHAEQIKLLDFNRAQQTVLSAIVEDDVAVWPRSAWCFARTIGARTPYVIVQHVECVLPLHPVI